MEDVMIAVGFTFYMIKAVGAVAILSTAVVLLHHHIFERN